VADISRRKAPWRTAFNIGQYCLSWSAAAAVLHVLGNDAAVAAPLDLAASDLVAACLAGVTYFVVNQLLVGIAVSLKTGQPLWQLIREDVSYEAGSNGALLAMAPLVALVVERGTAFLPLLVPPVLAVYRVGSIALEREHQAQTDALTGLPNRMLLASRTAESLAASGDGGTALLLVDLDRFKEVNDTLGHHVGDRFLQVIARRLAAAVRPGDTVVRLGGDEFALLLPSTDAAAAEETARRLVDSVCAPSCSRGCRSTSAPASASRSPRSTGPTWTPCCSTPTSRCTSPRRPAPASSSTTSAATATPPRGWSCSESSGARSCRASSRSTTSRRPSWPPVASPAWRRSCPLAHPRAGPLVPPRRVRPAGREHGLIEALTRTCWTRRWRSLAAWRREGLPSLASQRQACRDLSGTALVDSVRAAQRRHDVLPALPSSWRSRGSLSPIPPPRRDELRLLASSASRWALDELRHRLSSLGLTSPAARPGASMSTGRSFRRMREDVPRSAIVRSVVDLARGLGMRVVAEGVEDEATWALLQEMGCDEAQGWLLSRAEPAEVLTPWLLERQDRLALVRR
jgi:diguanylate cyclase (GGDEF)-like protein